MYSFSKGMGVGHGDSLLPSTESRCGVLCLAQRHLEPPTFLPLGVGAAVSSGAGSQATPAQQHIAKTQSPGSSDELELIFHIIYFGA